MVRQVVWKEIEGYPNYQISNDGDVFSKFSNKVLKQSNNNKGYLLVILSVQGNAKAFATHRLVAKHFVDNPLKLPQVNHKNSVRTDNMVENLEWMTVSDNLRHSYSHGNRCVKGEANANSKLTSVDVLNIRSLFADGTSVKTLKDKYKVSLASIYNVLKGKTWSNV